MRTFRTGAMLAAVALLALASKDRFTERGREATPEITSQSVAMAVAPAALPQVLPTHAFVMSGAVAPVALSLRSARAIDPVNLATAQMPFAAYVDELRGTNVVNGATFNGSVRPLKDVYEVVRERHVANQREHVPLRV